MNNLAYVGKELALFEKAVNWKTYWSSMVQPFIGNNILDVGAGSGSNAKYLLKGSANYTALEPD